MPRPLALLLCVLVLAGCGEEGETPREVAGLYVLDDFRSLPPHPARKEWPMRTEVRLRRDGTYINRIVLKSGERKRTDGRWTLVGERVRLEFGAVPEHLSFMRGRLRVFSDELLNVKSMRVFSEVCYDERAD